MVYMVEIYHNSRCSKSRAGLKYLQDNNIEYDLVDYLKEGITALKVKELAAKTKLPAIDLLRKQEDYFKKEIKGKGLTDNQLFEEIAANPRLLQRPIIVNGEKAVFAQPPEKVQEIL